jgi:hypothetical protein
MLARVNACAVIGLDGVIDDVEAGITKEITFTLRTKILDVQVTNSLYLVSLT